MHEVSLLENTLELALDYARQQNVTQIQHLTFRVGQLSGVIPEALQFAFDLVMRQSWR
jgi:hydrogenase nickel incorporation protein HypA/HybF